MSRIRKVVVIVCTLVALSSTSAAQSHRLLGTIGPRTPDVSSVFHDAGCSISFLAQAMKDSGLKPRDLPRLPSGTRISLRSNLCSHPSLQHTRETLLMLSSIHPASRPDSSRELADVQTRIARLTEEKTKLQQQLKAKDGEWTKRIEGAIKTERERLLRVTPSSPSFVSGFSFIPWSQYGFREWLCLLALALILIVTVGYVAIRLSQRGKLVTPLVLKRKHAGHHYTFVYTGRTANGEALYQCMACGVSDLMGSEDVLVKHMSVAHVQNRTSTVKPRPWWKF